MYLFIRLTYVVSKELFTLKGDELVGLRLVDRMAEKAGLNPGTKQSLKTSFTPRHLFDLSHKNKVNQRATD